MRVLEVDEVDVEADAVAVDAEIDGACGDLCDFGVAVFGAFFCGDGELVVVERESGLFDEVLECFCVGDGVESDFCECADAFGFSCADVADAEFEFVGRSAEFEASE